MTRQVRVATAGMVLVTAGGLLVLPRADALNTPQQRAVLRAVAKGESAILHDRPRVVCRLLTRRARRNSLLLFNLDQTPEGRPRPKPKSCARAVGYMIGDARANGELKALRRGGDYYTTKVVSVGHGRAHVRKGRDGDIYLVKRDGRWLGDYADFAPFDGSSGY